jgi:hypothetical protein
MREIPSGRRTAGATMRHLESMQDALGECVESVNSHGFGRRAANVVMNANAQFDSIQSVLSECT